MVRIADRNKPMKVAIGTHSGEDVYLVLRHPTYDELDEFRREHTRQRLSDEGVDFNYLTGFVDSLLVGCDNIEDTDGNTITPESDPNWKSLLERDWKLGVIPLLLYPTARAVANGEKKGGDDPANF